MRWHSIRWGFKITFDARDSEPTWAKMLRFPPHLHPVAPTRWKQPETNDIEVQPVQLQPTWYLLDKSGDHDLREWKEWWSPPFQGAKGSCHEVCQPGSARQRAITMKVQHQDIFCAMSLGMFGTRLSFCDVRDWLCCTPAKILLRLRSTCSIPGYHSGLPEAFRLRSFCVVFGRNLAADGPQAADSCDVKQQEQRFFGDPSDPRCSQLLVKPTATSQ